MTFATLRRWFTRSNTSSRRSADGAESMIAMPVAAAGAIHPTDNESDDTDDTEAVEGKSVDDSTSSEDASTPDASCGASCGATL